MTRDAETFEHSAGAVKNTTSATTEWESLETAFPITLFTHRCTPDATVISAVRLSLKHLEYPSSYGDFE